MSDDLLPTRATLLQRLKNWDDQAGWQDFFDTYWSLIYGLAVKGGLTAAEAQDVVQETMISVAKHIPGFHYNPEVGSFKAWLLNLTRWRIADQLRRRNRQGFSEPALNTETMETQAVDVTLPDLEKIWESEWELNLVHAATQRVKRRVDPQMYQIFDFYVNKEWPPEKVAKAFKITVNQVYLAKHRILEAMKEEIAKIEKNNI